jgi:hypothetical protein
MPEQRGVMGTVQRKCMNRRNRMRREERALVNHHTKKNKEDSVNCVDLLQCTNGNNIGNKDDGNDNNDDGLEAVTKNAINQQRSEEKLRELRSNDANTVRRNGALTRATNLNLPQEWIFSSPWGCCTPIHISGGHEDNHDNASDTSDTSNISDTSDTAKNGSNDHPRGIGGIGAVRVLVVTSIGNEDNDVLVFGGQTPIDVLTHLPIAKRTWPSGGNKKRDDANYKLLLVFPFDIEDAMLSEAASCLKELGGDLLGYNGPDVDVQGKLDNGCVAEGIKKSLREQSKFIRELDMEMLQKGQAINDVIVNFWMIW